MPRLTDRYDWKALKRRVRHLPIAADKQAERRAILAEMKRILKAASDGELSAVPTRNPDAR